MLRFLSRSRFVPLTTAVLSYEINTTIRRKTKLEGLSKNFLADAVTKASPSVCNVVALNQRGIFIAKSSGSGFLIEGGFVVTNAHVVEFGGKISITIWDGLKLSGRIHAIDKSADLALIKLDQSYSRLKLKTATLGNSSELRPGEFVAALGSPLTLNNSVTFGIVSTVARGGHELGMGRRGFSYIQTDAPINVGNSGGPLIDMMGNVIGINTMKLQGSDGISFAIPIDEAKLIIAQLKGGKSGVRPYIGMKIMNANGDKVVVSFVEPNSPADFAGLSAGDEIISINGMPVLRTKDVMQILSTEGTMLRKIDLTVRRSGGEVASLSVVPILEEVAQHE